VRSAIVIRPSRETDSKPRRGDHEGSVGKLAYR
jgi:hypothetical protein